MSEFNFGDEFKSVPARTGSFLNDRDRNAKRIIPCGIQFVDDYTCGLHPTDLMIISASTGAGKTTAGMFIAAEAARRGLKPYYFALEAFRAEIEGRLLFREVSKRAFDAKKWHDGLLFNRWMMGQCPEVREFEPESKEAIDRELENMRTLYRSSAFGHEEITKHFKAVSKDASIIILDHLHYVDTEDSESDNRAMKRIVKAVRDASLGLNVPVVCIAHLRKASTPRAFRALPEVGDIHGSSDISKIATKIVMLSPAPSFDFGEAHIAPTAIQVLKDRYAGACPHVGICGFNMTRMAYQKKYYLARLQGNGHTVTNLYQDELPYFARKNGEGLRGRKGYDEEMKLT